MKAKAKITNFVFENFPAAHKRALAEDTDLLESGVVDSIGILEIVSFIEQSFEIVVSDEDLVPENFGSIARIAAFVGTKAEPTAIREDAAGKV